MAVEIRLNDGYVALVDESDAPKANQYNWNVHKDRHLRYACAAIQGHVVSLHRYIVDAERGQVVDHINGNGLDNRRYNLRIVGVRENSQNRRKSTSKACTSVLKGVWYEKSLNRKRRWRASIKVNGRTRHLGSFVTEKEAA
jgi:hypothetical protein